MIAQSLNSGLPSTSLATYVLLMAPTAMRPFVGSALHEELQRRILGEAANVVAPDPPLPLAHSIKEELVQRLHESLPPLHYVEGEDTSSAAPTPLKKSRTKENQREPGDSEVELDGAGAPALR